MKYIIEEERLHLTHVYYDSWEERRLAKLEMKELGYLVYDEYLWDNHVVVVYAKDIE